LQCVAVCGSMLMRYLRLSNVKEAAPVVAVFCSVWLQCIVAVCCCSALQCVAVCRSVLQCVAVCCSVLQCSAVCCSVLRCSCAEYMKPCLFVRRLECVQISVWAD